MSYLAAVGRLLYATMTGTDIAAYELIQTYDELKSQEQITPLVLDPAPLAAGDPLYVHSAYFNKTQACAMDGNVVLQEGPYPTDQAVRLTKDCAFYPGFSGSPLLRPDGVTMTGLGNTDYGGTDAPCTLSNPCEVGAGGQKTTAPKGTSYGIPLYMLYQCLDPAAHELNFHLPSCPYGKPRPASAT